MMFPDGCCDESSTAPPSTYAGGTMMPLAVTGFVPAAVDRHRHPYAPHLQQHQQRRSPQLSYHQLRDRRNLCAAMSSSPVTSLDNGYRSMSSSSLSSPMSSSSSLSPVSYRPVYSPCNQPSYDCHGVPAHPSVADFPPQPYNRYYTTNDSNHSALVGLNDAQVPVSARLPVHALQDNNNYYANNNNNNNNNNNYNIRYNNNNNPFTDRYEYCDFVANKPTANK